MQAEPQFGGLHPAIRREIGSEDQLAGQSDRQQSFRSPREPRKVPEDSLEVADELYRLAEIAADQAGSCVWTVRDYDGRDWCDRSAPTVGAWGSARLWLFVGVGAFGVVLGDGTAACGLGAGVAGGHGAGLPATGLHEFGQ